MRAQSKLVGKDIFRALLGQLPMVLAMVLVMLAASSSSYAVGQEKIVFFDRTSPGAVNLLRAGQATSLFVDPDDHLGVLRAAADLQADVRRVGQVLPALKKSKVVAEENDVVIIGTLGKSALIDQLVKTGKLNVAGIAGKWEGWMVQTLEQPLPGVERALVIVGSDKRGTIFGIYEISEQLGVSPWYWWADVPVPHHENITIASSRAVIEAPVVRYRGIFLNDEQPALSTWAKQQFGGYNHQFYDKVFELILRLRGNYLWPAMWGSAFFDDDPLNGKHADEYGVVMGTSHHEPMMRAQQEWQRHGGGPWDYERNPQRLRNFWRGGLHQTSEVEKVITIGMRGDGDEPMSRAANVALLEKIVRDQRDIIRQQINPDITQVPQLWALYKEVQDYYEQGMRVPDDVLLLWCDDNWGNIRRLPTTRERLRPGGAGVYYHFDYVGGPRSYKWLNVTPIPKIWEQMHLAWRYQADRMWIVNVGDLKPMEVPIEFFLSYAWNPAAWPAERLPAYLQAWAAREFGAEFAGEIADIVNRYTQYNGRRKPELLEPTTYSLSNYREAERVVADYNALAKRAEIVSAALPLAMRSAFFQLVLYPVRAAATVNEMLVAANLNRLYAIQGRASTNFLAQRVRDLFQLDAELTRQYHEDISAGKWQHMMSQTHLGYTNWDQPARNVMPAITEIHVPKGSEMGVAVEGSEQFWPARGVQELTLAPLSVFDRQPRYLDIFNRSQEAFAYSISASDPWITLSQPSGKVKDTQRILVNIRWEDVPRTADGAIRKNSAHLRIVGPNRSQIDVRLVLQHPPALAQAATGAYVETAGVVAIEAENFSQAVAPSHRSWQRVPDHGRTLSGMMALPVDAPAVASDFDQADQMRLEYRTYLFSAGEVSVQTTLAPTLNFQAGHGLRYAISFDDEPPQTVNLHADLSELAWEKKVSDGVTTFSTKHRIAQPGLHTLKFWTVDAGVVLQKLVINAGGLRPSYLGPPESPRLP